MTETSSTFQNASTPIFWLLNSLQRLPMFLDSIPM